MKASELRLKNYVFVNNTFHEQYRNVPVIVCGISDRTEYDFPNSSGVVNVVALNNHSTLSQFDEFISPIPLTEEWLLKFGFGKVRTDVRYFRAGSLKLKTHRNGFQFKYWTSLTYVRYVHQLQNLYFALTGKELKIC